MLGKPAGPAALDDWIGRRRAGLAAAFLRQPQADDDPRAERADLDLLVFDLDTEELWPERVSTHAQVSLDLLHAPAAALDDPVRLAGMGLVTHRLLSSELVVDRDGRGAAAQSQVRAMAWTPAARRARLASLLEMGWLTVREVGVSWDWPALARFWLHMAQAAAVAAMLDTLGQPCPNVYTRAPAWAHRLAGLGGPAVHATMVDTLGLRDDVDACVAALRALHAAVRARTRATPDWPEAMRQATRREYGYWWCARELDERVAAALALHMAGDPASALFYLRYAAYSMLRLAMLDQRAREGWPRHIPFIRPETELRPDLQAHAPELLPLADGVFGGCDGAALDRALAATSMMQTLTLDLLRAHGLAPPDTRPWVPHRPRRTYPASS